MNTAWMKVNPVRELRESCPCAFLRNSLTKLANFKNQRLSYYVSWCRYSLSFPCDTLVLCMNIDWLKVNPLKELRESCHSAFLRNWLTKLANFIKAIGWVPTFRGGGTHWVFLATPWFFAWTQFDWRSIHCRELRESCPVRFWEIGLQSWYISQKIGWVPTFHGGGTHWVFLATNWF